MLFKKFQKQKSQNNEVDKSSSMKFMSMEDVIADSNSAIVPHILVSGASGTGTGYVIKDAIHILREKGERVIVIDFENNFEKYVSSLGGTVIDFTNEDFCINPMTLPSNIKNEEDRNFEIENKFEYLDTLVSTLLGEQLSAREKSVLYNTTIEVYKKYETPCFKDIYDLLSKDMTDVGRLLALKIEILVGGSLKFSFNQKETDIECDLICFSFGNLSSHCRFMSVAVLEKIFRLLKESSPLKKTTIVVPYLTSNIHQDTFSQYIIHLSKIVRRYNCRFLFCERNIGDFIEQYRQIAFNVPSMVFLNISAIDKEIVKDSYTLSQDDINFLSNCGAGEGLYLSSKKEVAIFKQLYKGEK